MAIGNWKLATTVLRLFLTITSIIYNVPALFVAWRLVMTLTRILTRKQEPIMQVRLLNLAGTVTISLGEHIMNMHAI